MKPEGAVKDALPIRNSTLPLQWLRIVLWPTLNQGRNISGGGTLPKIMFWMPETNTQAAVKRRGEKVAGTASSTLCLPLPILYPQKKKYQSQEVNRANVKHYTQ